jgi:hypothetical protein
MLNADTDMVVYSGNIAVHFSVEMLQVMYNATQGNNNFIIRIQPIETEDGIAAVLISILYGGQYISILEAPLAVTVYVGDIEYEFPARIVAILGNPVIIGGSLSEGGTFVFETNVTGSFTIQYVENLTRVTLQMGSTVAVCAAGNAPTQFMDVPPQVTADGRTVLPLRAMGYLLGAEVYWDAYTDGVTLTQNGQTFSFIIGEENSQRIEGRTMVPVRSIAEFFGATVNWNATTGDVEILKIN